MFRGAGETIVLFCKTPEAGEHTRLVPIPQ